MSSKANLGFVKAALRFAPALLRTPAWRLSVVFLTVVVAAIMTLIISVTSMKLSPDQEREYSLGVADYTANMPDVPVRGYKKLNLDHLSTLGRVELITTLPVTGLGLAAEEHRELRVSETPWTTSPYPKRYSLAEGRYPSAPGEIAISTALVAGGAVGGDVRIAVPGVDTSWKITGIIADKYLDDATIYAAPGTLSDVYRRIEHLTGIPQYLGGSLYWSAPSPEPVLAQLRVLNSISAALQELPAATSAQVLLSAADLHGDRPASGGNPVIYVWPAVFMPALVVIMAILLLSVWLRKQQVTLAAMGIQDSALILAIIGALTIMGLAALAVASPIALGISTIVRIILSRVYELPLSTFVFPWGLFPLFWLSIAGGITAGLAIAGGWPRRKRKITVGVAGTIWVMGGIGCLGFLVLSVLFLFPDILDDQNQIVGASFVVMASALMALWLTKTRRLWSDSLAGMLSRRMKERDAFSGAITWLLCGAIVGIPLMLVTTAVTTENTMNLTQIDSVPPNTVRVTMADRLGKPMEIPEPLQAQVDAEFPQQPIRIRRVAEEQSVLPQTTVQVGFDAFRMGQLWAFESVSDIDRWLGGLSPEQKVALNNGGILGTDARDGAIPVHVSSLDGTTRTETVTAAPVELPREYPVGMSVRAVALRSFAETRNLPLGPAFVEYPNLDEAAQTRAVQQKPQFSILSLAIDVHNELHHISVPPDLKALVLVSTVIMGVWILVLALGIAGRLSKHLDSLFALGVNRRWAGKVLALSLFPTLIPAILTGMASGYVGVWILKLRPVQQTEALPVATSWPTYGFVALGLAVVLALSFGLAVLRISSEKRK
ncbi:ABC transporter permease [Corynebacterium matruchotii]|uniref:ABC transporter permease n=1 Tax=Corynebacterium matruchotii TaxID=43768 RepID=UPI002889E3A5|nr:ABC transporter permease [Corynebacterium matruchotii]